MMPNSDGYGKFSLIYIKLSKYSSYFFKVTLQCFKKLLGEGLKEASTGFFQRILYRMECGRNLFVSNTYRQGCSWEHLTFDIFKLFQWFCCNFDKEQTCLMLLVNLPNLHTTQHATYDAWPLWSGRY